MARLLARLIAEIYVARQVGFVAHSDDMELFWGICIDNKAGINVYSIENFTTIQDGLQTMLRCSDTLLLH